MQKRLYSEKEVIKKRFLEPTVKMVRICEGADIPERLSPKQSEVVSLLQTTGECSVKELSYFLGVTSAVSDGLVKKEYANISRRKLQNIFQV